MTPADPTTRPTPAPVARPPPRLLERLGWAARVRLYPYFKFGTVTVLSWDLPGWLERPAPDTFSARELRVDELAGIARVFDRPAGELHRRAHLGDRCFCAFHDGQPVHMRWVTTRPTELPELDLFFCPGPGEVYVFDAHTLPPYRGMRTSSAARLAMARSLTDQGFTTGHAYIMAGEDRWSLAGYTVRSRIRFHRFGRGRVHRKGALVPPVYTLDTIPAPAEPRAGALAG